MQHIYTRLLIGLLFYMACCYRPLVAQTNPTNPAFCGVPNLTPTQALSLVQQSNLALQKKRSSGAAFTALTYVPIRPHIFRRSNGSGGFSLSEMNKAMAKTNSYYLQNGLGIQFYFAGTTPDYIDNDGQYAAYDGQISLDTHTDPNALNQYYINQFPEGATVAGYAYFPADDLGSTRSFIRTYGEESGNYDFGSGLIPHELGHNFNLIHTHGPSNDVPTDELVTRGAGANCTTAGDLLCDTPADPFYIAGAQMVYINGCYDHYDPASTARDANGDPYTPFITNLMSYWSQATCRQDFTSGQYDRIQAGLALRQSHTAYTLTYPATSVTAPGNLSASFTLTSVVLTWQDNASNEMGYFIERSTSPTTEFVPIGGVGPNVTTFSDTKFTARTVYYYRIRPSNTTTGSLSPNASVSTTYPPVTGLTTSNITTTDAQLNWNSLGAGITYDVQYRPVGSSTWTTSTSLTTTNYALNYLSSNTPYEWKVKSSTNDTYSDPVTFTTLCSPIQYTSSTPARVSASLSWYSYYTQAYTLQWRQQGAVDWTTVSGITTTNYSLTGLTSTTPYEWRVQGVCSATSSSAFSSPQSFTTLSCLAPTNVSTNLAASNSAFVTWSTQYTEQGRTFEIRYHPVGTTTWTTVSSITATSSSLTGLTNNTQYEWQVRSICSATESSDYSSLGNFTTFCIASVGLTVNVARTIAMVYWGYMGTSIPGSRYELQYRPVGSAGWITLSGILTGSSYASESLTGLASNTTYEARVRTICSATAQSDYTPIVTFATGCFAPTPTSLNSYTVLSSSAQLSWSIFTEPGTTFDLRYRTVGAANWNTISGLTNSYYSLTGLSNNTQYEWQVKTVCSATDNSDFTASATFTTRCLIPSSTYTPSELVASKLLAWTQTEPGASYEVRYRPTGVTDWTTISNLTSTSVVLSALTSNTDYEWQVKGKCSDGLFSDFSSVYTFHTASCSIPFSLSAKTYPSSATLSWYFSSADANTHYEIRYRMPGTTNWTTISNLTSSGGVGSVELVGLGSNMQYEWQIKTVCSATESSEFTSSSYFITQCHLPVDLYVTPQTTSAQLNWSFAYADADTRYEARYRVVGASNWITLSNLSSDNGHGSFVLTGLTNNTSYEWQIRTLCSATESSAFTSSSYFATQCSIPTGLSAYAAQLYSVSLGWYEPGSGSSYEVRYRLTGTTSWTTISNLTVKNIRVSELTSNTVYEWQVRTHCSDNIVSDFSGINSFTTVSCSTPTSTSTTSITTTSAQLRWNFYLADANTHYEARYRVVGTLTWITLSNLTSSSGLGSTNLTGLAPDTQYEWQIRTLCSATESSGFTASVTFRTVNPCPSMYSIKPGSWDDPTVWSCGRVPISTDAVQIKHIVTLPASYVANAKKVGFDEGQNLNFGVNAQLKLGL